MVRFNTLAVSVVCVLLSSLAARAQQASPVEEDPSIERTLEELSRGSYSMRQRATLDIWRRRDQSREQVQRAANHPDPEVASRAKWILRQWRLGALPGTPPEVNRLLQRTDGPEAVESLLEAGQFTAALVALEETAETSEGEFARELAAVSLRRRFPLYVRRAIQDQSLDQLVELIDRVADSSELAMCRMQLLQLMGTELPEDLWLPRSANGWTANDRDRATALLLIANGQVDAAIKVAETSLDPELLHQCRCIGAKWKEAALAQRQLAEQAATGGTEYFQRWSGTLIAADRAGDDALRQKAARSLASPPIDEASPEAFEVRWKTLASHGFVDEAILTAMESNPDDAARLALGAARASVAFDALGFPLERVDLDLSQWIDDALALQRQSRAEDPLPEVRKLLSLMKVLMSVGRYDAATEIAEKLSRSTVMLSTIRLREYVLLTLANTSRKDWLLEYTVLENEKTVSDVSWNTLSRTLPDADLATLRSVYYLLSRMFRGTSARERFQATYRLIDGEIPEAFNPETDFRRLHDYLTTPDPRKRLPNWNPRRSLINPNVKLVRFFARHGESELAKSLLSFLVGEGDVEALFLMAEQQLDTGRVEVAGELFEAVIEQISRSPSDGGRYLTAEDSAMAVKALVGLWSVARRLGDEIREAELEREIQFCLCTPSVTTRSSVAEYLGQRGATATALQAYQVALPMTVLGDDGGSLYSVARIYGTLAFDDDPHQAAHWFGLAVSGALEPTDFAPAGYVLLPLYVERWLLETAIKKKDAEAAKNHLQRIMQLDPLDVDSAERLLPKMRDAGFNSLADDALNELVDMGLKYSMEFPFDAMSANNLAWAAAMNEQRLDDALVLSRIAVAAEPESPTYRDTLAEVLFLLGRTREALEIEKGCLLDDPGQWHLHEQIEKYQKALAAESKSGDGTAPE